MWTKAALFFLGIALTAAYYNLRSRPVIESSPVQSKANLEVEYEDQNEVHIPVARTRPSQPQKFLTSYAPERESLHLDFAPEWEDELYGILLQLDAEHADAIFEQYKNEKLKHANDQSLNISLELDNLRMLNGESLSYAWVPEEERSPKDLRMLEINHQHRIKAILGDHAEFIHHQYQLHQQLNQ